MTENKREKLRAGVALLNAAAMLLEQASVEFGGTTDNGVNVLLEEALQATNNAAYRAVRQYDRIEEPA